MKNKFKESKVIYSISTINKPLYKLYDVYGVYLHRFSFNVAKTFYVMCKLVVVTTVSSLAFLHWYIRLITPGALFINMV